jgi:hypothetical protein
MVILKSSSLDPTDGGLGIYSIVICLVGCVSFVLRALSLLVISFTLYASCFLLFIFFMLRFSLSYTIIIILADSQLFFLGQVSSHFSTVAFK